jgi:hypothetical protein
MKRNRVPLNTLRPKHRSQRKSKLFQHRPLLDVQLQIRCRILPLNAGFADRVYANPALGQRIFQPFAARIRPSAILVNRVRPRECRRSKQAPSKPRTLLVGPVHQPHRHRRLSAKLLRNPAQHSVGAHHAQRTVEPSAIRNRIQVTPKNQRLLRFSLQRRPAISCSVVMMLHRKFP